jgi:hypothetical protein
MSVTVRARHEYAHPFQKVWAAFTDPEFYQAKFEGIGHRNVTVISAGEDAGGFAIETSREVPLEVPGFLRGVLGEWNTLLQSEHWRTAGDGAGSNELEISARGVPVVITGTMRLARKGKGCVNEVAITIRASVPLIGGKVEQIVARDTEATLASEYEFIQRYLDRV